MTSSGRHRLTRQTRRELRMRPEARKQNNLLCSTAARVALAGAVGIGLVGSGAVLANGGMLPGVTVADSTAGR